MNGTIVDIPNVSVSVGAIQSEHSPDKVEVVTFTDQHNNTVTVSIYNGKIIGNTWQKKS